MHSHEFNACKQHNVKSRVEFSGDHWYVSDGNGRKTSTNGTWLFAEDGIKVVNNMVFKIGTYLFKASVYA